MPLLDRLTLLPADLVNIIESLRQLKHTGPIIIIDTNGSLTIRDINDGFLTEVKRAEQLIDHIS
jgi:hypothetical protein